MRNIIIKTYKHSSYYDSDQFFKLARTHTHNFSILTTNIESLNSEYDELIVYIEELHKINFKFSMICLQETWLSENDDLSPFQIEGYTTVFRKENRVVTKVVYYYT